MTEERDPQLTSLFADAGKDFPDDGFVAGVMAGVEEQTRWVLVRRIGIAVALVLCAIVAAAPVQDAVTVAMNGLMSPLIHFEHPLPALILLPVNNVAAPLVLLLAGLRLVRRRLFS